MTESFDYPRLLQRALRSVVREVLTATAADGLPGGHHFYISLRTDRSDVKMPPFVRQRYPEEMTVVLQNQFWDLAVTDEGFAVNLRFDGMPARLEVPFDAVVAFFDPAAQFGLRFDLAGLGGTAPVTGSETAAAGADAPPAAAVLPLKAVRPDAGRAEHPDGDTDGESGGPGAGPDGGGEAPAVAPGASGANGEGKVLSFDRTRDRREPEE